MDTVSTPIVGLLVKKAVPVVDQRGSFLRCYCQSELSDVLAGREIVQINHSRTTAVGAIRGLHFQSPPYAEIKIVRCLRGRVWDVAVDLRHGSSTFLQWHAEELSAENGRMMIVPEGVAHGFQVLEAESELLYVHTAFYNPPSEGGVRFNEPLLSIDWPLPVRDVSQRDRSHPLLTADFRGISL